MKLPKLIIFDMAGTTVHDDDYVNQCLQSALLSHGATASKADINAVMGLPKPIAIRAVLEQKEGSVASSERVNTVHETFLKAMVKFYQTEPGIREVTGTGKTFATLRKNGVLIGLDTGFSRDIADTIIERLQWKDKIDVSVTSDEVDRGRPFPHLVHRAMELTGIEDPSFIAKVGDTISDIQEGQAANCGWVIGVTSGANSAHELKEYNPTHLLGSVAEIPSIFGL